jgi:hypothetical protein
MPTKACPYGGEDYWDETLGEWRWRPPALPDCTIRQEAFRKEAEDFYKNPSTAHVLDDGELREVRPVRKAEDSPLVKAEELQPILLGALLKKKGTGDFYRVQSHSGQSCFTLIGAPFYYNQSWSLASRETIERDYEILFYGEDFPLIRRNISVGSKWKCKLEFFEGLFEVIGFWSDIYVNAMDDAGRPCRITRNYFLTVFDPV